MQIQTDVSLKDYSTMRLGGLAKALTTVTTTHDLQQAADWAKQKNLPVLVLGGGSNVIFSDGYAGLVVVNRIAGYEIVAEDAKSTTMRVGAGEPWDEVVERSVHAHLHGIEQLSAIPGTAGATPVQNVGAYGTEIAETFVQLEAYNLNTGQFVTLGKEDCQFGYRDSMFKRPGNKHLVIVSITLRLLKTNPKPPFYATLQDYLDKHAITAYTPQTIRQAVIALRALRLPDPSNVANTGSFFKNPVVTASDAQKILAHFPNAPHWELPNGSVKFPAGWLIEHAGLRGYQAHGMKLYEHHALVFINDHAKNYNDLLAFKNEVIAKVQAVFGITLEQEPELL